MKAPLRKTSFTLWAFVLASAVPFLYQFMLETTRISPLSPLSRDALFQTGLAGAQVALSVAGILALLVLVLGLLFSFLHLDKDGILRSVILGLSVVLLAIGILPAVENFFYIVVGASLKTTEDTGLKILIAGISLLLSAAFSRPLLALAGLLARSRILNGIVLVSAALALGSTVLAMSRQGVADLHSTDNPRYNVLIISSDGIDADRMSLYGYDRPTTPFLDEKSGEFLICRNAFTNNASTTGSITSLFTGRSPMTTHVIYPPDILVGEDTVMHLPGILGRYGYYRSNWSVPYYADAASQNILDSFENNVDGLDVSNWLPINNVGVGGWFVRRTVSDIQALTLDVLNIQEATNPFEQITGGGNTLSDQQRFDGVLSDISSTQPFFTHVHFMDTHGPRFAPVNPLFSAGVEQTKKFQTDFMDDAIHDFDSRVARIYAALEQAGKLDDTILVVTTDHPMKYKTTRRIPILIRLPHMSATGDVIENVQRIDLAPTILSLLNIPVPDWMEGQDLLQPIPPDRMIIAMAPRKTRAGDDGLWVYPGSRPFGRHHKITVLYCDKVFVFSFPLELSRFRKIRETSSPCTIKDDSAAVDAVRQMVTKALAASETN